MDDDDLDLPYPGRHWYDNEKEGWYTFDAESYGMDHKLNIIRWLLDNVDNPTKHARWKLTHKRFIAKFRYERDYMMFVLRWS